MQREIGGFISQPLGVFLAHLQLSRVRRGKAIAQGLARNPLSQTELIDNASQMIRRAQKQTRVLMQEGVIAPPA